MVAEQDSSVSIDQESTTPPLAVERYQSGRWASIRNEVLAIEAAAFGDKGYNESDEQILQMIFEKPENYNFLLIDEQSRAIVGYTLVELQDSGTTAYVRRTAIIPKEQGKGNVGKLMAALEAELVAKGVRYLTRHAEVTNGYADAVQRHYGNKIDETATAERRSTFGHQRFFKIILGKDPTQTVSSVSDRAEKA